VTSLPYHHPFILLDRMLQLDNMTRGRLIFGMGPGSLAKDARSCGTRQPPGLAEGISVVRRRAG
jgi:limonene 1,2-monooxygenase